MFANADAYERFMGRWSRLLAPSLVALVGVRDGDELLDVGSGTGALSVALHAAAPSARITGVDRSEDYVRHAAREVTDALVRFQVGDALQLAFADGAFDKALSALVLCFVPDPARAIREMIRVTKPGGIVAAALWDYGGGMEMLRVFWDEVVALDPAAEPRDERHLPLCARGELAALFRAAGALDDVHETELHAALRFTSFADYWEPFLAGQGPAGAYVVGLSKDARAALEGRLRARLLGAGPDGPIEMRARAWAVKGTVA